jgi:hypothetical protein
MVQEGALGNLNRHHLSRGAHGGGEQWNTETRGFRQVQASLRIKTLCHVCVKHTYNTFKTIILLKIKFLHFSLKITWLRNRRYFKR